MALMVPSSSFVKKLTISSIYFARVCEETPGVGGTPLQTNDRHTSQGGIIASQSLSFSPCYFPVLPPDSTSPPPSRPKLLATRRELCA